MVVERRDTICLAERDVQGEGDKADSVIVEISESGLDGMERFDQGVAGESIFAHGAVHDLPTFVVAGQRRRHESRHRSPPWC